MTTETTTDLTTQTPIQIDTELARLYGERITASMRLSSAIDGLHYAIGDKRAYYGWKTSTADAEASVTALAENESLPGYQRDAAQKSLARVEKARTAVQAIRDLEKPLNAEFVRRGGWTRAFLVSNGNGHVHSSMNCSTCNRNGKATEFGWMVEYSGHDEAEIVAAAGWRACTVCYPTAPVGTPNSLPTKMFSQQDKDKAAAKAEREAAKAARDAKKKAAAPTKSGDPLTVDSEHGWRGKETFQTERSAMIWATDAVSKKYAAWARHGMSDTEDQAVRVIAEAVAEKRGVKVEVVLAEIEAKGKKKGNR